MRSLGISYLTATILMSCSAGDKEPASADPLQLYDQALDQIIYDNFLNYCVPYNDKVEQLNNDIRDGKMDARTYARIDDSLKIVAKKRIQKCILEYADTL